MSNKELVFNIIKKSPKHLTAYEILDKLQKVKKTQPMTVYRALANLIEEERIHKSNQTKLLCCAIIHIQKITVPQSPYAKNVGIQKN